MNYMKSWWNMRMIHYKLEGTIHLAISYNQSNQNVSLPAWFDLQSYMGMGGSFWLNFMVQSFRVSCDFWSSCVLRIENVSGACSWQPSKRPNRYQSCPFMVQHFFSYHSLSRTKRQVEKRLLSHATYIVEERQVGDFSNPIRSFWKSWIACLISSSVFMTKVPNWTRGSPNSSPPMSTIAAKLILCVTYTHYHYQATTVLYEMQKLMLRSSSST